MKQVITATTVQEAINKGLHDKGWLLEEVDVEILDKGKTGFLRKRPAKVCLTKKETNDGKSQIVQSINQVVDDYKQEGYEQKSRLEDVYWDGKKLVIQKNLFEKTIQLTPPEHVILHVNDQPIDRMIEIEMDDQIINPLNAKEIEQWIKVTMLKNNFQASIQLKSSATYVLVPQVTKTSDIVEVQFEENARKELPFTTEDICSFLKRKGIIQGIDDDAIEQWLQKDVNRLKPMIIAKGKEPIDGNSTQFVELYRNDNVLQARGKGSVNVEKDEAIDWFKLHDVGSVQSGDKLVEIIPATEGVNGINLLGESIIAQDGAQINIQLRKGVTLSEDERFVMATMDGRPNVTKNTIMIHPVYAVNGDLTLEVGSIKFKGDVLVNGDVCEGLSIEATGNIDVKGSVVNGNLKADGHVTVAKNIMGSQVTAGGFHANHLLIANQMEDVLKKLEFLEQAYHQLEQATAYKNKPGLGQTGAGRIIKYIVENNMPTLGTELKEFHMQYIKAQMDWEIINEWFERSLQTLIGTGLLFMETIEECRVIRLNGEEIVTQLKERADQCFGVYTRYIHNSNVQASGQIRIIGVGSYNSVLVAGEDIMIGGKEGMVRGGSIQAESEIKLKALGGPGDVRTNVMLKSSQGHITTEIVYSGVIIDISGVIHHVHNTDKMIQFVFDPKTHAIKGKSV